MVAAHALVEEAGAPIVERIAQVEDAEVAVAPKAAEACNDLFILADETGCASLISACFLHALHRRQVVLLHLRAPFGAQDGHVGAVRREGQLRALLILPRQVPALLLLVVH
ncbi:MAG: hypothetical protein IPL52_11660 [Flavobacteriales bacterium]|nr:hypothetical protein [Flavobacteriales bacterium]